jgi:hypothetical protein
MTIGIVSAVFGAIAMALMIVTDRLMVRDCYQNNPNHAWFVSSAAGAGFGLLLTAVIWLCAPALGLFESTREIITVSAALFLETGWLAVLVGALGVQYLLHYFRCFGSGGHAVSIAAWFAATPIFVYLTMIVSSHLLPSLGLPETTTTLTWAAGVVLATAGLVWFEVMNGDYSGQVGNYRRELVKLVALSTLYAVLLKHVFTLGEADTPDQQTALQHAIALMPYYWLGFAAGMRVMLRPGAWHEFRHVWRKRVRFFWKPIVFVEIIGMLVFFFEYVSISKLDPTLVSLILGLNIVIVYVLDLLLGLHRRQLEREGARRQYVLGVRILVHALPVLDEELRSRWLKAAAVVVITLGLSLTTL